MDDLTSLAIGLAEIAAFFGLPWVTWKIAGAIRFRLTKNEPGSNDILTLVIFLIGWSIAAAISYSVHPVSLLEYYNWRSTADVVTGYCLGLIALTVFCVGVPVLASVLASVFLFALRAIRGDSVKS